MAVCSIQVRPLSLFLEWIENFETRTFEILLVTRGDRQSVAARSRRDVVILNRHSNTGFFGQVLLLRPDMRDLTVEAENPSLHLIRQPCEPGLQKRALAALLLSHPVGELSDDNGARVAAILFRH